MESIKYHIDNALYAYDPQEFFPVFRDGELENRTEFVAYKAQRVAERLGNAAVRTASTMFNISKMVLTAARES